MGTTARYLCLLLAIAALASFAFAQLPTGTILGVVRDPGGSVVPGTMVTVTSTETGLTRTGTSDGEGGFRFAALPVGAYELRAASTGFQTAVRTGITLEVGQEAVVNIALQVGELAQTVEVAANAQLVNTTSSSLGAIVNENSVAQLPLNGRNYIDLTFLQPGIAKNETTTSGGTFVGAWFSSNGMPLRSNTYMIDGAVMQNVLGGTTSSIANNTLGIEGIREWRVVANNFSAEYGLTMGSQMEIVTKSGTNAYHGSLFEYLRNSALDARNFFDYQTALTPGRLPPFRRNNFGASVGGPVLKDKLFFFGTYEGLRERFGVTSLNNGIPAACRTEPLPASCVPSGSTVTTIDPRIKPVVPLIPVPNLTGGAFTFPFNRPTTENYGQGRVDWAISQSDNLFGRYTENQTTQLAPLGFPGFVTDRASKNRYLTASETHIFSPTLLNTFRFSFSDTALQLTSPPPTGLGGPPYEMVPGLGIGVFNIAGIGEVGPRPSAPIRQFLKVFSYSDDMYWTKGAHSLKFGTLINNYQPFYTSGAGSTGTVAFSSYQNFLIGNANRFSAKFPGSILDSEYRYKTLGFYLQDDWKVTSRLTLNLGVRYEFYTDPNEINGNGSAVRNLFTDKLPTCASPLCLQASDPGHLFNNPSRKNLSPRIGFAWDVFGNGKTALRGGSALLYDVVTFQQAIGGLGWPYSVTSSSANAAAAANFTLPLTLSSTLAAASPTGLDYDLQQPYSSQSNLTLEQQLPWDTALQLSYATTRGINLYRRAEQNPRIPFGTPVNGACVDQGRRSFDPNNPVPYCFLGTEPRINPNWNSTSQLKADSNSWYHGLQFQLRKRFTRGFQFQSSYTWSKSLDETQGNTDAENAAAHFAGANSFDRRMDKGPTSSDLRHNWSFNALYALPQTNLTGFTGGLVNGWRLGGIVRMRTGLPFTPVLGGNRSRSGTLNGPAGLDRPDFIGGVNAADLTSGTSRGCDHIAAGKQLGTPDMWFDPCAFALPAVGFFGNAGRNSMRGPGLTNFDLSLTKDTPLGFLGEAGKLEFRLETFNLFNHANFATPEVGVADTPNAAVIFPGGTSSATEARLSGVGVIQRTSTLSRQIQFALKILF